MKTTKFGVETIIIGMALGAGAAMIKITYNLVDQAAAFGLKALCNYLDIKIAEKEGTKSENTEETK